MKLILHIGQSKTGTTALQSFLLSNKNRLAQEGILYPDYYLTGMPLNTLNHNSFAEELSGLTRHPCLTFEEYCKQFTQEMKSTGCETMILSAESFFGAPQIWRLKEGQDFWEAYQQKLENLRHFTSGFDTDIIGYFRSPEDWFESAVSQIIRYAGLLGKNVYESDEELFSLFKPHLDYPKLLTLWHEIIEPEQMMILPYERDRLENQDIVQDFCKRIGSDCRSLNFETLKHKTHSSLDKRYIAVKKQLNEKPRTKTQECVMIECLDRLNARLPRIEKYQIDNDLREKLDEHCRSYHEWMSGNYGQNGQPFFQKKKHSSEKQSTLADEEIQQAVKEFNALYRSWPMTILRLKVGAKSFLRNKHPRIYAFVKNMWPR